MVKFVLAALILVGFSGFFTAQAQTVRAASCSNTAVQAAFNAVTKDGAVVKIPSGSCTWTKPVRPKCFSTTIQGAGDSSTIITEKLPAGYGNDALFLQNCSGKSWRVTGIDWEFLSGDSIIDVHAGSGSSLRLDHNIFHARAKTAIALTFEVPIIYPGVVVDHNVLHNAGILSRRATPGDPSGRQGAAAWAAPMVHETQTSAVYIEDNTLILDPGQLGGHLDCDNGGSYVFRHNRDTGVMIGNHGWDTTNNSCVLEDVYLNTINGAGIAEAAIKYRGGTGVAWGNLISGKFSIGSSGANRFGITNYRSNAAGSSIHGYCNGYATADRNTNRATSVGWGCNEQPGMGSGGSHAGWARYPIYEWDNCLVSLGCTGTANQVKAHVFDPFRGTSWMTKEIVSNRDYYDSVTSFKGKAGVGIGKLSARPSTCTTGVAYWATNTFQLYQCVKTNTWQLFYVPFRYPHPLTAG